MNASSKPSFHNSAKVRLLVVVLICTALLRIVAVLTVYRVEPTRTLRPDSQSYVDSARALVELGRFAVSPDSPNLAQTVRTPGYPAFIAAVYAIFGETNLPVLLAQIVLSVAAIGLVYLLGRILWSSTVAVISAIVLALDSSSFLYSQMVLTETLFTFVLVLTVWAAVRVVLVERPSRLSAVVVGLGLAGQALIRPVGYYLILVFLLTLLVRIAAANHKRELSIAVLLMLLPWVLLVGGWQLRNWLLTGSSEFSHIRGINLLYYRGADIVARRDGVSLETARTIIEEKLGDTGDMSHAELGEMYTREGLKLIGSNPSLFFSSALNGAVRMLFIPGAGGVLEYLGMPVEREGAMGDLLRISTVDYVKKWLVGNPVQFIAFVLTELYLLCVYGFAAAGAWYSLIRERSSRLAHSLLLGTVLYFLIISAGPEAYARFRVPIMPFLALYAGCGVACLVAWIRGRLIRTSRLV